MRRRIKRIYACSSGIALRPIAAYSPRQAGKRFVLGLLSKYGGATALDAMAPTVAVTDGEREAYFGTLELLSDLALDFAADRGR